MKKTTITILNLLIACCCFAQNIDTTALRILQRSYDKLAIIGDVSYRLDRTDTMIRAGEPLIIKKEGMQGSLKKNVYLYLRFDNSAEWLVRNDTVYANVSPAAKSTIATTKLNSHEMIAYGLYAGIGTDRPSLKPNIVELKFIDDKNDPKHYVINTVYKMDYRSAETKSKLYYSRIWIDKNSMFPTRRSLHSERTEEGAVAVDVYDFSLSLSSGPQPAFDASKFFRGKLAVQKEPESLQIGSVAPPFTVTDVSTGKKISSTSLKGKVVLLDFWYVSCPPCRELMPAIQQLHQKFKGDGLVVVGINTHDVSASEIAAFVKEKQITYPQYYQATKAKVDYRFYAAPTTMVIGKDGKIKLVEVGLGEDTPQKLEQAIRIELKGSAMVKR